MDPVKDPLAAGVRKGPVDPDVDALVIANVNLHKVVGSGHNLNMYCKSIQIPTRIPET